MKEKHLFSNRMLITLLVPVVCEQVLNSLMGTVDTVMVSRVGSAAMSAASLVDSINILIIYAFAALATGGAIICAQYVGSRKYERASEVGRQLVCVVTIISVLTAAFCLIFQDGILHLIFGQVDADVMEQSKIYFFYTAMSFPFIALYNAGAAVFRSQENTKGPMLISVSSNLLNILGNAFLIFVLDMGIAGAAIATLLSRVYSAVFVLWRLYHKKNKVPVRSYHTIRPNGPMIKKILTLGIPNGIENGMFQLGKLAIQSTVSTLGTIAIAANAMTSIEEQLSSMAAIGIGIGMMTVVGECIGAGRQDEAVYYIKKLFCVSEVVMILSCVGVYLMTGPLTRIGAMEAESASLCIFMTLCITIVKPIFWTSAFVPAYGMRAAGDVRFSMTVTTTTMWVCRFCITVFLIRVMGFGPIAVWIGMFCDWAVRGLIFQWRFYSRKWLKHQVI